MMNRRRFLKTVSSFAFGSTALTVLAACATDEPLPGPVPTVGFSHLPPLNLAVGRVDVKSAYKSPMSAPNAEHRMPSPPERALFDWGLARLKAAGGGDNPAVAEFVIEDASVVETKLEKSEGFSGLFTYEPEERYDAQAVARLTVEGPQGSGAIRVTANRAIEVRENATLAEREQKWVELVENLMADFNTQMEQQVAAHLGAWLVR